MPASVPIQVRINPDIRDRAAAVLQSMGLTISDAVRMLLTRTANEGCLPLEMLGSSDTHDAWFRAKILQALEDARPLVQDADTEARSRQRQTA